MKVRASFPPDSRHNKAATIGLGFFRHDQAFFHAMMWGGPVSMKVGVFKKRFPRWKKFRPTVRRPAWAIF